MIIVSPRAPVAMWEVWLFASPDYRQPVQECGLFREEGQAVHVASLLRDWLHLNVWNDNVLDNSPDPEGDAVPLLALREELHTMGIDPARVLVDAKRRRPGESDNAVRCDEPHEVRGPHFASAADVRAWRR